MLCYALPKVVNCILPCIFLHVSSYLLMFCFRPTNTAIPNNTDYTTAQPIHKHYFSQMFFFGCWTKTSVSSIRLVPVPFVDMLGCILVVCQYTCNWHIKYVKTKFKWQCDKISYYISRTLKIQ